MTEMPANAPSAAIPGRDLAPVSGIPLWIKIFMLAWVVAWIPIYTHYYGWTDFLHLSDIAIAITAIGLWFESPVLLTSQAISTLIAESIWTFDVAWAAVTGHILIPGVEYLWETKYPLWLRLMTFYHLWLTALLVWAVWRVGYHRRALKLQMGIATAAIVAGRLWGSRENNINFCFRDPFFGRQWGPAPVHIFVMVVGATAIGYLPVDWLLRKLFSRSPVPAPAHPS